MNEKHGAIRKIRKGGRVKIGGVWFRPNERWMKYDGRLDGLSYLFGRYIGCGQPDDINGYRPFVCCCVLEENMGKHPDERVNDPKEIDGTLPWEWWDAE